MDAGRVRGSHCATSAGPVPCPLSPTFPISASARRSQMGREGKWPWGWGRETQLDITPRVYFYLTAGCLSGRVRWPCQSHRRGRCLPTGTHVRAGTWSLGPRQGRRQPWPTAPLFLHLLPHLRQTPGLPRCLREPPQGAPGGGLPEQCARMRRLWAVHIASRGGGVLPVNVAFPAAREPILSPLGDRTPIFHLVPPKCFSFGSHFTMSMVAATATYRAPASV